MITAITIGTRKSKLALWQSNSIKLALEAHYPGLEVRFKDFVTKGELNLEAPLPSIGGKGLFTQELEEALVKGEIDIAVHSLKDLPVDSGSDFCLAAITEREAAHDVLITQRDVSFFDLPAGACVGTSSPRRETQLKKLRPDLRYSSIRGNVDTRINKVKQGLYDACVLAQAGVVRLGLEAAISQTFTFDQILPAPGQGAMAVQCCARRQDILQFVAVLDNLPTRIEVSAERAFLQALNAGCSTPLAAYALINESTLTMRARCVSSDGKQLLEFQKSITLIQNPVEQALQLGTTLADEAREQGVLNW